MILNLGCGNAAMENAINHDIIKHSEHVDTTFDLNYKPWPWANESMREVYALDVLEHLYNFVEAVEECHRLLMPKGILYLRVPYAGDIGSFRDPTHIWKLTPESMDYFIVGTFWEQKYGYYSTMRWKILDCKTDSNVYWQLEKDA